MKWNSEDINVYINAKEYVDSIILPLLPISFNEKLITSAQMTELVSLISSQLERKFKGRMILLPGLIYQKSVGDHDFLKSLLTWERELNIQCKYIFYVTADLDLKIYENQLNGTFVFIPPIFDIQKKENYISIIEEEVNQIASLIMEKWKK